MGHDGLLSHVSRLTKTILNAADRIAYGIWHNNSCFMPCLFHVAFQAFLIPSINLIKKIDINPITNRERDLRGASSLSYK